MSFSNNSRPDRTPGLINGNPLNGLCEKVCIQTRKVFDACLNQTTLTNYSIALTNLTPPAPTTPLTFISGKSTSSQGVITSYTITKLVDSSLSRVQATIQIPMEVAYVDANNVDGVGYGTITVTEDVVLNVPSNSVIPIQLAATVSAVLAEGVYVSGSTFSVTACVTVVLKVEAEVELLIPSYGYCFIPPCEPYTEDVCSGVFDLPLFPTVAR